MFTGLVEDMGTIAGIGKSGNSFVLSIDSHFDLTQEDVGASIAVDGVCLTVVQARHGRFSVDVSPETLSRTTLQERKRGDQVNLERALRISDRLGGHLVSGHIDGTGLVKLIRKEANALIITFSAETAVTRYIVEKGSVAIDGISLTVNSVEEREFSVSIIPHTAEITTLGRKKTGSSVNIETDIIGKYVEKFLQAGPQDAKDSGRKPSIDDDFLREHGFS
ncbi:MAG TPA: riboflavin synthase [Thermodesulfobacteriota bacterium]|nr:riboflavin synthase [Deltaproteobacteria bacterium]HNU72531.1 riboflavin synthase [Thermodesulfobacteriota bacterium]HOC39105.1 riboflavin synthase [Thermodesulfobacteriota bacterium]